MLSIPDMALLGVLALLVFGEEKLPGIMRQAGRVMREIQGTSESFIREMERAGDMTERPKPAAGAEPSTPVSQENAGFEPVPEPVPNAAAPMSPEAPVDLSPPEPPAHKAADAEPRSPA